ncbi:MAG: WG repeat-containing protein, partial [Muribaculaceae bacterium]|nr:WG repeat-containing protein [Muribaculaceae bacterium]
INIDGSVLIEQKYDKIELEKSLRIIIAQNGSKTDLFKEWGRKINDLPINEYVFIEENRYYVKMDDNEWKIMDDYGRCTNIEVNPILYIFKDGSILSTSRSKRTNTPVLSYILITPNGAKQRVLTIYNSQELDNIQIFEDGDFVVIRRYSIIYGKTINYWLNKYNGKILVPYKGKWNNNRSTVTVSQPSEGLFILTEHIPACYENDDKISLNLNTERGKLIFEAFERSTILNFNTGEEVGIREMDGKIEHRSFYGRISQFHNGFAVIKYDNLSKYINKNAEEVFEYYSEAKDFSEGYGVVKSHKGYGIIDEKGMLVVPCLFDEIGRIQKNYIYG